MSRATDRISDAEGLTPKTALVFVIFLVVGPPIAILLVSATTLLLARGETAASYNLASYFRMFGFFAIASYIAGGVQALFLAFVASIAQAASRTGLVPLRPVF